MMKRFFNTKRIVLIGLTLFQYQAVFSQNTNTVFMFAYFKGNGEAGLHLAYRHDGYKWTPLKHDSVFLKPEVAKDKLMRDPCIIRGGDNQFHMVWTVSWNDRGIGYASSPDLIHWSKQQFIPVMKEEPAARNCWAPEIYYDSKMKNYLIYWSTTIPGRFKQGATTGDDGYNHRIYYTTTKDLPTGQKGFTSFTKTKLLYDPGFNAIDATIKKTGNHFFMFFKDETKNPPQKNIRIAVSDHLTSGYGKPSAPITGNYWAEGPTVIKIGNNWVVYFDKYMDHRYGAVTSTDLKAWTDISDKISFPKGARHGTVFTVTENEFNRLSNQ